MRQVGAAAGKQLRQGIFRHLCAGIIGIGMISIGLMASSSPAAHANGTDNTFNSATNSENPITNHADPLRLTAAPLTSAPQIAISGLGDELQQEAPQLKPEITPEEPINSEAVEAQPPVDEEPPTEDVKPIPADVVPPYAERLRGPNAEPLFNPSPTLSWIIAILVLIFFALLFGWFVRRLVNNALAVDEAASNDLFQSSEEQVYHFDDDEVQEHQETPATPDHFIHQSLNDDDDNNDPSDDQDSEDMLSEPAQQGFMSRLFSGGLRRNRQEDNSLFSAGEASSPDNEQIIDVEPEPVETMTQEAPEPMPEEPEQQHDDQASAPATFTPITIDPSDTAPTVQDHVEDTQQSDYMETARLLENRQAHNEQAIGFLEQKITAHADMIKQELTSIRNEANTHRQELDKTMEMRFATISDSVEAGLAKTEKLATDNIEQKFVSEIAPKLETVDSMSSEEIETKIQSLDKKFNDQSRIMDVNFTRVLQKLDNFATPAPQLSKLANDTSELKTQIAALQKLAKEQPVSTPHTASPEPVPVNDSNTEILHKLEQSLTEQKNALHAFRDEHRTLANKFDALNERIDRLEGDLQTQQSALVDVLDHYQSAPVIDTPPKTQSAPAKADALGITASPPIQSAQETREDSPKHHSEEVTSYTNGHVNPEPQQVEPIIVGTEPAEEEETEADITPILVTPDSLPPNSAVRNAQKAASISPLSPAKEASKSTITNANARDKEEDQKTIRPLTFNFSNSEKGVTNR